jgi:hypothetical protein
MVMVVVTSNPHSYGSNYWWLMDTSWRPGSSSTLYLLPSVLIRSICIQLCVREKDNKFLAPSSFLCWVAPESPHPVTPRARNHGRAGASGTDVRLRTLLEVCGQLGFWRATTRLLRHHLLPARHCHRFHLLPGDTRGTATSCDHTFAGLGTTNLFLQRLWSTTSSNALIRTTWLEVLVRVEPPMPSAWNPPLGISATHILFSWFYVLSLICHGYMCLIMLLLFTCYMISLASFICHAYMLLIMFLLTTWEYMMLHSWCYYSYMSSYLCYYFFGLKWLENCLNI